MSKTDEVPAFMESIFKFRMQKRKHKKANNPTIQEVISSMEENEEGSEEKEYLIDSCDLC